MISSTVISVDKQVLGFCLDIDFFAKVKNKIDRDMFDCRSDAHFLRTDH